MAAQAQLTRGNINLKGSATIVAEFFDFAVNSILYQRGIYPEEAFQGVKKYGLTVMVTSEELLREYLNSMLRDIKGWLEKGALEQLVLVVINSQTKETVERWSFTIETNQDALRGGGPVPEKSDKDIQDEIKAIIRQIVASVTFLPLLEGSCHIDVLVYLKREFAVVPMEWQDSDPHCIDDSADVKLRAFNTQVHKVEALVSYKRAKDDEL